MLQIVDENTRMCRILKGFSDIQEIDVAEFEAKYGIKQAQFLDLKALKGDNSDNIPGLALYWTDDACSEFGNVQLKMRLAGGLVRIA